MELDDIKDEYNKTLKILAEVAKRTVIELDKEISESAAKSKNIEDILIKSSEII